MNGPCGTSHLFVPRPPRFLAAHFGPLSSTSPEPDPLSIFSVHPRAHPPSLVYVARCLVDPGSVNNMANLNFLRLSRQDSNDSEAIVPQICCPTCGQSSYSISPSFFRAPVLVFSIWKIAPLNQLWLDCRFKDYAYLEAVQVGKSAAHCRDGSTFLSFYLACVTCIESNAPSVKHSRIEYLDPTFAQFINYCDARPAQPIESSSQSFLTTMSSVSLIGGGFTEVPVAITIVGTTVTVFVTPSASPTSTGSGTKTTQVQVELLPKQY